MYLAITSGLGPQKNETDLCLVAEKPDAFSVPVRISDLRPNPAAMHRIGPEEAVYINYDDRERALIITAYPPGAIYLTPNLMQMPGVRTKRIKLLQSQNGWRTFYDRERGGWEEWVANKERTWRAAAPARSSFVLPRGLSFETGSNTP